MQCRFGCQKSCVNILNNQASLVRELLLLFAWQLFVSLSFLFVLSHTVRFTASCRKYFQNFQGNISDSTSHFHTSFHNHFFKCFTETTTNLIDTCSGCARDDFEAVLYFVTIFERTLLCLLDCNVMCSEWWRQYMRMNEVEYCLKRKTYVN